MPEPTLAKYVFLPWVREGAAANNSIVDSLGADENQPASATTPVKLSVNNSEEISIRVRLVGPGEVTGIDPQQVVRTEPRHRTPDFEPNYFPAIEFDRPDFPWMFTPARQDGSNRLRPWICLVVVRKQEGVTLRSERGMPLPMLEIKSPATPAEELPRLSESWAWAHAQVSGSTKEKAALTQTISTRPERTISRLLCPRKLEPKTEYYACVVPAFAPGVRAGLNQPPDPTDDKLRPAWLSGEQAPAQVLLPVYYYWEFGTGVGDDFESLVARLEPRALPPKVGKRPLDISRPGFPLPPEFPREGPGTVLSLEGALRAPTDRRAGSTDDPRLPFPNWPDATRRPFQNKLLEILNTPAREAQAGSVEPLVAPPIYGRWQAARQTVNNPNQTPATSPPQLWLDELNLDPRNRATANFGTEVVQSQQEQLMASAWEQVGDLERVNQLLRQAQLSRSVNTVFHTRHFSRFSEGALLQIVAPVQSRMTVERVTVNNAQSKVMLQQKISRSVPPLKAAVSPAARRLARPRGVISRRVSKQLLTPVAGQLARTAAVPPRTSGGFVARLLAPATTTPIFFVAAVKQDGGFVTLRKVSESFPQIAQRAGFGQDSQAAVLAGPGKNGPNEITQRDSRTGTTSFAAPGTFIRHFELVAEGQVISGHWERKRATDPPEFNTFRAAASAHQEYLARAMQTTVAARRVEPLTNIRANVLQALNPSETIQTRVRASFKLNDVQPMPQEDPLAPVLAAPTFPQPMYEALRDLSQDYLLPGLEHVPPNTITLLETNADFIESYLVGLNAEMSRELLWRGYPTDQRGTYFRQFWDTRGSRAQTQSEDIPHIHEWPGTKHLGENLKGSGAESQLVLLVRGELLRRYPNTVIYAVRALPAGPNQPRGLGTEERHPLFRGTLKPDITFLGFNLSAEEAMGNPGWFFMIQQQPTEPRFGLDVATRFADVLPKPTAWNQLSWGHLAASETAFKSLTHVSLAADERLPDTSAISDPVSAKWRRNSAHMAYITKQQPVRIAIHAQEMIPHGPRPQ
jgi:hypothetical protein